MSHNCVLTSTREIIKQKRAFLKEGKRRNNNKITNGRKLEELFLSSTWEYSYYSRILKTYVHLVP